MRVRFAPSPTGHLHVGNARTALLNWLLARGQGGTFILRIEDTDAERSTRESERQILEDLRWMGLFWDEGVEAGGSYGPYRQSERLQMYRDHAGRLVAAGHAYYCFCSPAKLEAERQAQLAAGLPPRYIGTCRTLTAGEADRRRAAGEAPVVRLRVPDGREVTFHDLVRGPVAVHTDVIGDPILVRSDGMPAYNFAVVVDDGLMAVTHVIRGEDHISNTPRQILAYEALGWAPPAFAHLSLILGPDHAPLSKRHGATSVAEFRARGYLPEALVNYLALIGWSPSRSASKVHRSSVDVPNAGRPGPRPQPREGEPARGPDGAAAAEELLPALELARRFRLEDVSHSAGVFDEDKLAWVNRHYLKTLPAGRLVNESLPFLRARRLAGDEIDADARAWLAFVLPGAAASVDRLDQVPDRLRVVFTFDAAATMADEALTRELADPAARQVIEALAEDLSQGPRLLDRETFRAAAGRVRERTGLKGRALLHPIRVALTGAAEGPELDLIVPAIDRGADLPASSGLAPILGCRERVRQVVDRLSPAGR
jgi:glutamyl-tRNA synthetase/nondiscriminating glutamyl-tRNA synthetase